MLERVKNEIMAPVNRLIAPVQKALLPLYVAFRNGQAAITRRLKSENGFRLGAVAFAAGLLAGASAIATAGAAVILAHGVLTMRPLRRAAAPAAG